MSFIATETGDEGIQKQTKNDIKNHFYYFNGKCKDAKIKPGLTMNLQFGDMDMVKYPVDDLIVDIKGSDNNGLEANKDFCMIPVLGHK